MKDILSEWVSFRLRTVRARSQTSLNEAEARIHTLEGRLIVLVDIEEVIRIIRGTDDPKKELITHFGLSDTQAEDILEIKLRQLALSMKSNSVKSWRSFGMKLNVCAAC